VAIVVWAVTVMIEIQVAVIVILIEDDREEYE
jgi:hypothetical protein